MVFENNNQTEKDIFIKNLSHKLLANSLQEVCNVSAGDSCNFDWEENTFTVSGQKMYLFFRPITQDLLWERGFGEAFQDDLKKIHIYTLGFIINETSMNEKS